MATGRVKWFNNAKGYGFILPDEIEGDLFAHYSSIQMDGYRTLKAGQTVTFDIVDGDKGSHAVNIVPEIEDTPEDVNAAPSENAVADEHINDQIEAI
ncbi:MAG: cold shock domain-containing protein CspD [Cellvibrionaceae bacterium]